MGLMDHDVAAEQDKQKQVNERLQKQSSHLEKTLNEIDALKAKHGGTINLERCLSSELSTILTICGLAGGTSGKKKEVKKQILHDKNITNERLTVFVDDATKRLQEMKEQIPDNLVHDNSSLPSEAEESDDDDSHL